MFGRKELGVGFLVLLAWRVDFSLCKTLAIFVCGNAWMATDMRLSNVFKEKWGGKHASFAPAWPRVLRLHLAIPLYLERDRRPELWKPKNDKNTGVVPHRGRPLRSGAGRVPTTSRCFTIR